MKVSGSSSKRRSESSEKKKSSSVSSEKKTPQKEPEKKSSNSASARKFAAERSRSSFTPARTGAPTTAKRTTLASGGTPTPTATPTPVPTPTPVATATPPAPTATTAPTATPSATPSPVPNPTPVATGTPTAAPANPIPATGLVPGPVSEQQADGLFLGPNGQLYGKDTPLADIPTVRPNPANLPPGVTPSNATVIHINGIQNDVAVQQQALQAVADRTGFNVIGIHNSTAGASLAGFVQDVGQCTLDKAGLYNFNPATVTAAQTIYKSLQEGTPVHIMAHSQGALVTSGALTMVRNQLVQDARLPDAAGQEAREMLERFSEVQVETFGGAAASYPSGPQYVHYINTGDPVPMTLGLGGKDDLFRNDINADDRPSFMREIIASSLSMTTPGLGGGNDWRLQQAAGGPGSVVHYVNDLRGMDPFANHDFMQAGDAPHTGGYIAQRVPFEEALRGNFHDVDTHR